MNMNCFHVLIVAVVPSCRIYIGGGGGGGLISVFEKLNSLRFQLYQIFSSATQERKMEYIVIGDYIIYFTFPLRLQIFLQ